MNSGDRSLTLVKALAESGSPRANGITASTVPPAFVRFTHAIAGRIRPPEFTEHSVRFARTTSAIDAHRLTHYFDVASAPRGAAEALGAEFLALCAASAFVAPPALEGLVREVIPAAPGLAQVVLGIDARAGDATRLKYYVLFDRPSPDVVDRIGAELGVARMPGLDPAEARIVGLDIGRAGLGDVKVYLRLDLRRVPRTVRNHQDVAELTATAREVVLQQCLVHRDRRQLHFHATDSRIYAAWLARRAPEHDGIAACLAHVRAVETHLGGATLLPSIIGFEHRDGRLETDHGNIYFHVEDLGARRPLPR